MDVTALFGPFFTDTLAGFNETVPLALPIAGAFALLGIVIAVIRKFGIKTR